MCTLGRVTNGNIMLYAVVQRCHAGLALCGTAVVLVC